MQGIGEQVTVGSQTGWRGSRDDQEATSRGRLYSRGHALGITGQDVEPCVPSGGRHHTAEKEGRETLASRLLPPSHLLLVPPIG